MKPRYDFITIILHNTNDAPIIPDLRPSDLVYRHRTGGFKSKCLPTDIEDRVEIAARIIMYGEDK